MSPEIQLLDEKINNAVSRDGGISYLRLSAYAAGYIDGIGETNPYSYEVWQECPGEVEIVVGRDYSRDCFPRMRNTFKDQLVLCQNKGYVFNGLADDVNGHINNLIIRDAYELLWPVVCNGKWQYQGNLASIKPNIQTWVRGRWPFSPNLAFYQFSNKQDYELALFDSPQQSWLFKYIMNNYGYIDKHMLSKITEGKIAFPKHYITKLNSYFSQPWLVSNDGRGGMKVSGIEDPRPNILRDWFTQRIVETGVNPHEIPFISYQFTMLSKNKPLERNQIYLINTGELFSYLGDQPIQESASRPWFMYMQNVFGGYGAVLELSRADVETVRLFDSKLQFNLWDIATDLKSKDFLLQRFLRFIDLFKRNNIKLQKNTGKVQNSIMTFPMI